jgi:hypothetical protein
MTVAVASVSAIHSAWVSLVLVRRSWTVAAVPVCIASSLLTSGIGRSSRRRCGTPTRRVWSGFQVVPADLPRRPKALKANGPGSPSPLPFQSLLAVIENETVLGLDLVDLCLGALDDVRLLALVFPVPDDDPIPHRKTCHERLPLREPHDPPRLSRELGRPSYHLGGKGIRVVRVA